MSKSIFKVQEHTIPGQHIRGYRFSTADEEAVVQLAVKQYTPWDNLDAKPGDISIIAAHANGFPKEIYEPLWDDLHAYSKTAGFSIRNIFISDVYNQGTSSILNEYVNGNDPHWQDHSRDLLCLANTFRSQLQQPLFGIGHSLGGTQIAHLSLLHPTLFTGVVLIDPVLSNNIKARMSFAISRLSSVRRDRWPSRAAAMASFARSKFYRAWDPRALALWGEHGLRDLPTRLYPDVQAAVDAGGQKEVTLTTPKAQEVMTYARHLDNGTKGDLSGWSDADKAELFKITHADVAPNWLVDDVGTEYAFAVIDGFEGLSKLRPSVLYIFGKKSDLNPKSERESKVTSTGTHYSGNGGTSKDRVKSVILDAGHLVPMETPKETAHELANWIEKELIRWKREQDLLSRFYDAQKEKEKFDLSEQITKIYKKDLELMKQLSKAKM